MTKAILVIDIPDKSIEDWVVEELKIIKYDIDGNFIDGNDYCHGKVKLKPIPEKKYAIQGMKGYDTTVKECNGWNACIDEIIGEEE